ncbi:MAG TPA: DUF444 family protein, partial [Burkholderiales bacterium]|nr:DUF444 family protein [Burkholderiales bacterium]
EQQFFQVSGTGGTVASTAFDRVIQRVDQQFAPSRYNIYVFYASDGENFAQDHDAALRALRGITGFCSYMGYVEIAGDAGGPTEMGRMLGELQRGGAAVGTYRLTEEGLVWDAIRKFFREQAEERLA